MSTYLKSSKACLSHMLGKGVRSLGFAVAAASATLFSSLSHADFYISSFGTNQLMRFNEDTGAFLGVVAEVNGPFASQIGFDGDLFVSSHNTGEVLRFDSITGEYKGVFIKAHEGGLMNPTAPNFGPDNKVYVGDLGTNRVLRYDRDGKFLDVFADSETSDLNGPFMMTFDDSTMFIASGYANSILRYDLKTKEYMGVFAAPGDTGMNTPVGLEFGPDGNLYTSSSNTNEVLRFDGKTGEFIDKFVPAGSGGMSSPRAIRFGGPNSDLYVISLNTNEVLQFDRTTGEFIRVVATAADSGMDKSRGLSFTPRPELVVYSHILDWHRNQQEQSKQDRSFKQIFIESRIKDFRDRAPKIKLISIVSSDPSVDISKAVKGARYNHEDYHFKLDFTNNTGIEQKYTITYRAINKEGMSAIATTTVEVPAN
jgi:outer membrane protein assembly factor BamB